MTANTKVLIDPIQPAAAETTQYISPTAGRGTIIDKFTGTNTSGTAATITVKLIKVGTSAAALNTITSTKSLAANEAYNFPELIGHFLAPGDFISTLAGTAAVITIRSSGRELT